MILIGSVEVCEDCLAFQQSVYFVYRWRLNKYISYCEKCWKENCEMFHGPPGNELVSLHHWWSEARQVTMEEVLVARIMEG